MTPDLHALALDFHETYERLAPSFGYRTRTSTRRFDPESRNGKLMMAVCGEVIARALKPRSDLVCVPREPTENMVVAGCNAMIGNWGAYDVYKAMLATAEGKG